MQKIIDLRPYHLRHRYSPVKRFLAIIGMMTLFAIILTGFVANF